MLDSESNSSFDDWGKGIDQWLGGLVADTGKVF
jgi:hypothetical protein